MLKLNKKEKIIEHGVTYFTECTNSGFRHWFSSEGSSYYNRTEGPSIECLAKDHNKCDKIYVIYRWYKNNQMHREDGPAELSHKGDTVYALDGKKFQTREQFLYAQKDKIVYIKNIPHLIDGRPILDK